MKWLGFIVLLLALLIPMPVMAIGVSPYIANINVQANSYTELVFTVTGCSTVDITLEGIPLTVEPSHTSVVNNQITVKIKGSPSVPSGVYTGYLVILESGQQVGAGVKVSLTVNHINNQSVALTTTVLQPSSDYHNWSSGSGSYYVPSTPNRNVSPPLPTTQPNTPPTMPTPPTYPQPPQVTPVVGVPMPTEQSFNFGIILIGLGVAVALFAVWYLWNSRRKLKKIETG